MIFSGDASGVEATSWHVRTGEGKCSRGECIPFLQAFISCCPLAYAASQTLVYRYPICASFIERVLHECILNYYSFAVACKVVKLSCEHLLAAVKCRFT